MHIGSMNITQAEFKEESVKAAKKEKMRTDAGPVFSTLKALAWGC